MTRDETIALWQNCERKRAEVTELEGSDAAHKAAVLIWNRWAEGLLAEKSALELDGTWKEGSIWSDEWRIRRNVGKNEKTQDWFSRAFVDFSGHAFTDTADFSEFVFPGETYFGPAEIARGPNNPVTFEKYASFAKAVFGGTAQFTYAVFNQRSDFSSAEFKSATKFSQARFMKATQFEHCRFIGEARFGGSEFLDGAWFNRTKFENEARFYGARIHYAVFEDAEFHDLAIFESASFSARATFENAKFLNRPAFFNGVNSLSNMTFNGAHFERLPDFNQAVFAAPPRLDNMTLGDNVEGSAFWSSLVRATPDAQNIVAKYRAIRSLAIQSHDQENEARAFKGEIRAKRGSELRPWHSVFWFGIVYDALSDFGRSMLRPLVAWALSAALFNALYLADADKLANWSGKCPDGAPYWVKSLVFALKNAVPLVNWDREQIRSAYSCLYDIPPSQMDFAAPATNAFIQAAQSVWSAILIFLFLLALRNHFKIK